MVQFQGVTITWLGHDSFRLSGPPVAYIDPYQIRGGGPKADFILISHDHFDHLSIEDVRKVAQPETTFVTVQAAARQLEQSGYRKVRVVKPKDALEISGVRIEAVPAYNVNKFRAPGQPFHPKEAGYVGFIVQMGGVRIYHTGDSDVIPEMKNVKTDVALLPVSGTYVMTVEEAVEAAKILKPKLAIPMHYGAIIASEKEAKRFKELAPCPVEILPKE